MTSSRAPGVCGSTRDRASGGSASAGVGACDRNSGCEDTAVVLACDMRQGSLESGCEDAAIVLACDIRQGSLCTGLRDLLWFLLDIAPSLWRRHRWPISSSEQRMTRAAVAAKLLEPVWQSSSPFFLHDLLLNGAPAKSTVAAERMDSHMSSTAWWFTVTQPRQVRSSAPALLHVIHCTDSEVVHTSQQPRQVCDCRIQNTREAYGQPTFKSTSA